MERKLVIDRGLAVLAPIGPDEQADAPATSCQRCAEKQLPVGADVVVSQVLLEPFEMLPVGLDRAQDVLAIAGAGLPQHAHGIHAPPAEPRAQFPEYARPAARVPARTVSARFKVVYPLELPLVNRRHMAHFARW